MLIFFTQGVAAGGRGGVNLFSFALFSNDSVFIEGAGGRGVFLLEWHVIIL